MLNSSFSGPLRPRSVLFSLFFVASFAAPYDVKPSPPCVLLSSHLVITPPLITDTVFWLVVVYVVIFWDRIRSRSVLFHFIFHKTNRRPKQWPLSSPNFPPRPNLVPNTILIACTVFGWLLFKVVARGGRLRPTPGPFLSLSLWSPHSPPKTTGKSSPHAFRLGCISSNRPPPASADLRLVVVSIDKTAAT